MKKWICLLLAVLMLFATTACGETKPESTGTTPTTSPSDETEITVEDISWELTTKKEGEDTYLAITYTNNSSFTLTSFKMKFKEKEDLTKEQRDAYWTALHKSQGEEAKTTLQDMRAMLEMDGSQGLIVYVKDTKVAKPGATATARCQLNDQLDSRNVAFPELYNPHIMEMEYEQDGETVLVQYNFVSKRYTVR